MENLIWLSNVHYCVLKTSPLDIVPECFFENCLRLSLLSSDVPTTTLHEFLVSHILAAFLLRALLPWFNNPNNVGFDVLTAVVMKLSVFWDIKSCSPVTVNWKPWNFDLEATCSSKMSVEFQRTSWDNIPEGGLLSPDITFQKPNYILPRYTIFSSLLSFPSILFPNFLIILFLNSRIMTKIRIGIAQYNDGLNSRDYISGRARVFWSPHRPDSFWDQNSLLSDRYRELFSMR
jgi:hypothetical protein